MNKLIRKLLLLFCFIFTASWLVAAEMEVHTSTAAAPAAMLKGPVMQLNNSTEGSIKEEPKVNMPVKPKYVRGIHMTAWLAGSMKGRERIYKLLEETEINTVVIDIKEMQGEVYIPGVKTAEKHLVFVNAIPKVEGYLAELKKRGIYTVARMVVFKDNLMPRKNNALAVKDASGNIWQDRAGITWVDPFSKEVWDYNIEIAERAAEIGFDEIQFDYIRFPSDGNVHNCRYSKPYSSAAASKALVDFLTHASKKLHKMGAYVSIDVFGLTTTYTGDMGIGQKIVEMTDPVDFVSPMVYPSHYNKGEYGIPDPDREPYDTVYLSLRGANKRLSYTKMRPWLQDFSLKSHYGKNEVRAQIHAAYDNGIGDWILWNPSCKYTIAALKEKKFSDILEKSGRPEPKMRYATQNKFKTNISTYTPAVPVSTPSATVAPDINKNTLTNQTTNQ
jgi:hypothetical protein